MQFRIHVYPLPPKLERNPYLDQLYGHIDDSSIVVRRIRPARRGLQEMLLLRGAKIWHVHFFGELVQRRKRAAAIVWTQLFLSVLRLVKISGARIVWTAHNIDPHEIYHPDLADRVSSMLARQADAVIAHSRAAGDEFITRYGRPKRLEIIPHGNWIGVAGPLPDRELSRARLGWTQHRSTLLGIGTLRPYKGFEDLIEAFGSAALEDAQLVIAGHAQDTAYAGELSRRCALIPGASVMPGFVPDEELPFYFAAADVVVLPYRKVLTSGMLFWPLSYGVPVIVPGFPSISEFLSNKESAFLYAPGDISSLRDSLEAALRQPDLATKIGEAGRDSIRAMDWRTIAARTAELYRILADPHSAGVQD